MSLDENCEEIKDQNVKYKILNFESKFDPAPTLSKINITKTSSAFVIVEHVIVVLLPFVAFVILSGGNTALVWVALALNT